MKYPLTGDYLQNLPEPMQKLYRDLEDSIFEYICEQFKTGDANEKSVELIRLLQRRGLSLREIEKRIRHTLGLSAKEIDRIYDGAISRNKAYFTDTLNKMRLLFDPKRRAALRAEEAALRAQTLDELTNITRSLGFATRGPDGRVVASPIMEAYQRILDTALIQVQSGAFSGEEAIQNAIRQLAASGIQWVDYESGWHNRVEVAVRRAVMTGISQLSARYSEQMRQEIGTDFVEVSAHRGARDKGIGPENHKEWQGRVYHIGGAVEFEGKRYQDFESVTGYGTGEGLAGWNCRHHWYPFVPGVNEPTYTEEQLRNIDPPDFEFEGKTYTAYEATQKQRQLETAMRAKEREMIGYKAAGDEKAYTYAKARHRALSAEYKRFSKAADLPEQRQRLKFAKDAENSLAIRANNGNIGAEQDALLQANETVAIPESVRDDFSDFEELTLSKMEHESATDLYKLANETGNEHGVAIVDGHPSDPFTSNLPDKIYIPEEYRTTPGTKLFHSHTNVTPPSQGDLRHLTNPNVDEIGVVTANGDVFVVSRGYGELVGKDDFDIITDRIVKAVDRDVVSFDDFSKWTVAERNYMAIREEFFRICREFGWTMKGGKL